MAIIITHPDPEQLLKAIYKAIDDKKVVTWIYDKDKDFTHANTQWENKAWLHPEVLEKELRFGILGRKEVEMSPQVYAIYHGRFVEMLLAHFDSMFGHVITTSQKTSPDNF